jgi:glycosyltransferase involved in cell wall biosynthesis
MGNRNTQLEVWLLQTGEPLHLDDQSTRPMRAINLANALVENGHKVVLWSSAFYHQEKRHRSTEFASIRINSNLEIRLIQSPGYSSNIGLKRLWDHAIMAQNLKRQLAKTTEKPDVAFIGYPPIEVAYVMGNWLKKNNIKFILDIKDLWPSVFIDAMPSRITKAIARLILSPYFRIGKNLMRNAAGISTMSQSFLNWAYNFSGSGAKSFDIIVPLTSPDLTLNSNDLSDADKWWDNLNVKFDGKPRICFVGSHSQAFDMQPIYEAALYFQSINKPCDFVICGDGPMHDKWKAMMKDLPNVYFPGWIDRAKTKSLASRSIATIAPYKNLENFVYNLPNKVIDSLSLGLPILSPLMGEVNKMINEEKVGLCYGELSVMPLHRCIEKLIIDKELCSEFSLNADKLFKRKFSYTTVYNKLVRHLEKLSTS